MDRGTESVARVVFQRMMANIREDKWPVGAEIPSERDLIEDFGASRIAIREAISMLRGLGVLDVNHGRRTRVREMGPEVLGELVPLMIISSGSRMLEQVFEIRLALETTAARLAAARRTPSQLGALQAHAQHYRALTEQGNAAAALPVDLALHAEIAQASGNPLFPILLKALSGFISYSQRESGRADRIHIERAMVAHETIVEAIAAQDGGWAVAEMEAHLQFSRVRRVQREETTPRLPS